MLSWLVNTRCKYVNKSLFWLNVNMRCKYVIKFMFYHSDTDTFEDCKRNTCEHLSHPNPKCVCSVDPSILSRSLKFIFNTWCKMYFEFISYLVSPHPWCQGWWWCPLASSAASPSSWRPFPPSRPGPGCPRHSASSQEVCAASGTEAQPLVLSDN